MKVQFTTKVMDIPYCNTYMRFTYTDAYHDIQRQVRHAAIIQIVWLTDSSFQESVLQSLSHGACLPF